MEIDDIELGAIKRFLTIIEAGSINAAAQRLHIAQPPLSRQMKQLELRLGVKLFERGKRTVTLTDSGRLLQNRAAQLLSLLGNTVQEMREIDAGNAGEALHRHSDILRRNSVAAGGQTVPRPLSRRDVSAVGRRNQTDYRTN